ITGNIRDINETGRQVIDVGRINGKRLITQWIYHLALNAFAPDFFEVQTMITGKDPKQKQKVINAQFPDVRENAGLLFEDLVDIFIQGRRQPFVFACETAWQFAKALAPNGYDINQANLNQAWNKSKSAWYDTYNHSGDATNRYLSLFFKGKDISQGWEVLSSQGFVNNSIRVFKPLLEVLTIL
ncbi:MAG: hypothetical protein GY729_16645, partial [Desulfobacteraceae bacterium]|nr:hypothetical protein [Desulfobacteraceae bacterium]